MYIYVCVYENIYVFVCIYMNVCVCRRHEFVIRYVAFPGTEDINHHHVPGAAPGTIVFMYGLVPYKRIT